MAIHTNKDVTEITYNGVNVPLYHKTQTKSTTITSNGTTTINKDADYDGMTSVEITTNVPTPAPTLQTKSVTITSNGSQSVSADSGYDGLEQVNITTNVPAPAPSLQDITITENGTYTHAGYDGYDEVIVNVSGGGGGDPVDENKQVLFIDYDGTPLYSYTYAEAMALTSLPANPSHSGLTAQGWNWTLAQIQSRLTTYNRMELVIGQNYVTSDGATRVYYDSPIANDSITIGVAVKGTVTIDWGDGSTTSTLTGTSITVQKTSAHTYSSAGSYTITITSATGTTYSFYNGIANAGKFFGANIKKIELGSGFVAIKNSSFINLFHVQSISIPKITGDATMGAQSLSYTRHLKAIVIPETITTINGVVNNVNSMIDYISTPAGISMSTSASFNSTGIRRVNLPSTGINFAGSFFSSSEISSLVIPNGTTTIKNSLCYGCQRLKYVEIPASVTSIETTAFSNDFALSELVFKPTTPPSVATAAAFGNLQTHCIIYVPSGSLSAYTSAANYPSSSTYTYVEY